MTAENRAGFSLHGPNGQRKYLTPAERRRFIAEAEGWPRREIGLLCLVLAWSGCRISEALALTAASFDFEERAVAIRSLKKRGRLVIRQVPLPDALMAALKELADTNTAGLLWPLCRSRAWRLVHDVMACARIAPGLHATAKGLRHGFGVHAVRSGVPLNLVQRWLGHASIATTAIYTDVMGEEEREIAARMWTAGIDAPAARFSAPAPPPAPASSQARG